MRVLTVSIRDFEDGQARNEAPHGLQRLQYSKKMHFFSPEQDQGAEFFPVYHCLFLHEDMLSSTDHACSLQYYLVRRKEVNFAHTFKL